MQTSNIIKDSIELWNNPTEEILKNPLYLARKKLGDSMPMYAQKTLKHYLKNGMSEDLGTGDFFKPDTTFIKWIVTQCPNPNNPIVFDIGCGTGNVANALKHAGAGVLAMDLYTHPRLEMNRYLWMKKGEMLHFQMEDATKSTMIRDVGKAALMLFCRPCHSNFVERTIDNMQSGSKVMVITKSENLSKYNDLGKYAEYAEQVQHKGSSVDNEIVLVLTKP